MTEGFNDLEKTIIAVLLASKTPVSTSTLKKATGATRSSLKSALKEIEEKFLRLNLPLRIRQVEDSYEAVIDEETGKLLSELIESGSFLRSLSRAALETLAVVAVNQPVTRKDIMRIRGVAPDSSLATLLEYGLIDRVEKDGKTYFVTTEEFLRLAGLKSRKELESLVKKIKDEG